IFIHLVAEAHHEALKIEGILLHIVVRHEPLEHAESGQPGARNMIMAEEIQTDITLPAVVQKCLISSYLRSISTEHIVAGRGRGAGISEMSTLGERCSGRSAEGVEWT